MFSDHLSIYSDTIDLQKEIAKNVISEDTLQKKIEYICLWCRRILQEEHRILFSCNNEGKYIGVD